MKQFILSLIVTTFISSAIAQKDKSSNWEAVPSISGIVNVTVNDIPSGNNLYKMLNIKPYAAKTMQFRIKADGNYIIKINSKTKSFVDQKTKNGSYYIFQLPNLDSLNIMLVGVPKVDKPVAFTYSYSIADTAKINLDIKDPKQTFEQLLSFAINRFENLSAATAKEYASGLFFNARAVIENGYAKQLTGIALDTKAADKDNAEWNKKIKAWLKDYKLTEINKLNREQLNAKSNYLFNEATEYTKWNISNR